MSGTGETRLSEVAAEEYRLARLRQYDMDRAEQEIDAARARYAKSQAIRDGHLSVVKELGGTDESCMAALKARRKAVGYDDEKVDGSPIRRSARIGAFDGNGALQSGDT